MLDLRLDPGKGIPAWQRLAQMNREEIEGMLVENADEPYAREIARCICSLRKKGVVFQALRIDINSEFEVLEAFLDKLPDALADGGRVAILTFHSGEDRLVKKAFCRNIPGGNTSFRRGVPGQWQGTFHEATVGGKKLKDDEFDRVFRFTEGRSVNRREV